MGLLVWIIIGAIVGWLTSVVLWVKDWWCISLYVVCGIVGAVLVARLLSPLVERALDSKSAEIALIFVALVGAALLMFVINLIRRRIR